MFYSWFTDNTIQNSALLEILKYDRLHLKRTEKEKPLWVFRKSFLLVVGYLLSIRDFNFIAEYYLSVL
ncbi:MAG: hypothetical protein B6I32_07380 [Desulfobacterium sp. 4572_20]|nr:MAG: hypothetical protein B6I32_07380 [Desulfobacterium sp. 4572_20]